MTQMRNNLMMAVMSLSSARDLTEALAEWDVVDFWEDPGCQSVCRCGKEGLREVNVMYNRVTGHRIPIIGSVCIDYFGDEALSERRRNTENRVRDEIRARHRRVSNGLWRRLGGFFCDDMVDADMVRRLTSDGAFYRIAEANGVRNIDAALRRFVWTVNGRRKYSDFEGGDLYDLVIDRVVEPFFDELMSTGVEDLPEELPGRWLPFLPPPTMSNVPTILLRDSPTSSTASRAVVMPSLALTSRLQLAGSAAATGLQRSIARVMVGRMLGYGIELKPNWGMNMYRDLGPGSHSHGSGYVHSMHISGGYQSDRGVIEYGAKSDRGRLYAETMVVVSIGADGSFSRLGKPLRGEEIDRIMMWLFDGEEPFDHICSAHTIDDSYEYIRYIYWEDTGGVSLAQKVADHPTHVVI